MATVTLTPNVSSWVLGDAPITVALTGGDAGYPAYFWESNNGTFADRFASSTIFTPNNGTQVTNIIGRRVLQAFASVTGTYASYGTYGGIRKTGGIGTTWDSAAFGTGLGGGDGFMEAAVVETNTEKAWGLSFNSTYADPTVVDATNSFILNWHFSANGTVVARKQGTVLGATRFYKAGDTFRVAVEGTKAVFYHNGERIFITPVPVGNLYGVATMRSLNSTINNPRYFVYTANNVNTKTIAVSGMFPEQPNYSYELNKDNRTLASTAEDGSTVYRLKGGIKRVLNLQFTDRPYSEYKLINDFWEHHQKHIAFYYNDIDFGITYYVTFDSGLRVQPLGPDRISMTVVVKEV